MKVNICAFIILISILSCGKTDQKTITPKSGYDSYMFANDSSGIKFDSIMSDRVGVPVYHFGEKVFDEKNQTLYFSGYLNFQHPGNESKKVGNYVYTLPEGIIVNSYVDNQKSERRVEDGDTYKTYVNGVGRDFGVRLYSEYDDEIKNKLAKFLMDTSAQNIKFLVEEDQKNQSSIELRQKNIIMEAGIPEYNMTMDAAKDAGLPIGALFSISNQDGTSQLHIKTE